MVLQRYGARLLGLNVGLNWFIKLPVGKVLGPYLTLTEDV